jgi:hypothetical protein
MSCIDACHIVFECSPEHLGPKLQRTAVTFVCDHSLQAEASCIVLSTAECHWLHGGHPLGCHLHTGYLLNCQPGVSGPCPRRYVSVPVAVCPLNTDIAEAQVAVEWGCGGEFLL